MAPPNAGDLHYELWCLDPTPLIDDRGPHPEWFLVGAFPMRLYAGMVGSLLARHDPTLWSNGHLEVWYTGPEAAPQHEDGFEAGPWLADVFDRDATPGREPEPSRPGPYPDRGA
jgi:hypothetical protein